MYSFQLWLDTTCPHVFQRQIQIVGFSQRREHCCCCDQSTSAQRGCKPLLLTEETTRQWFRSNTANWVEMQLKYIWKLPAFNSWS